MLGLLDIYKQINGKAGGYQVLTSRVLFNNVMLLNIEE